MAVAALLGGLPPAAQAAVVGGGLSADLALGAPASQSSTSGTGLARLAVDGVTSGDPADRSLSVTNVAAQPWWQVDLGQSRSIGGISVWNRTDAAASSLTGFHVFVSDVPFAGTTLAGSQATQGVLDLPVPGQAGRPTTLTVNRTGRYVRVQLTGTGSLSLAEVQVFAPAAAVDLAAGKPVTASSSAPGWPAAALTDGVTGPIGWSSANSLTSNHSEWAQVDLGAAAPVSSVVLYPRSDAGNVGYGFPVNFTIQTSVDGVTWTTASTQTGYPLPGAAPQTFSFAAVSARYLKLNATSLRANPNDGGYYRLQLAELQAFGPSAAAFTPPTPDPETISADILPTPQTNGTVYSVEIVGNTVYAGGQFTEARPAGSAAGVNEVPRKNLLAFDLTTGALLPWAPVVTGTPFTSATAPDFCTTLAASQYVCDTVFRIRSSPDGSRIYVGGDFTAIDGTPRYRVAAFDTATGALVTTFHPAVSSRVRALAVTADRVYIGGAFTSVDSVAQGHITAVDLTGKAVPGFSASTDYDVWSMAPSTDGSRIVVGGRFGVLSGQHRMGLGTVMADTGAAGPWNPSTGTIVVSSGTAVTDLAVDGSTVFASGYDAVSPGTVTRFEGRMAIDVNTGNMIWADRCLGDTQSLAVAGGVVYSASHSHDCEYLNVGAFAGLGPNNSGGQYQRIVAETEDRRGTNAFGEGRPDMLATFPTTNGGPTGCTYCNGPWSVTANGTYVVYGGEFTTVDNQPQQGLVRFEIRSKAPRKTGPTGLNAVTVTPGTNSATLTWTSAVDRDDPQLTYNILRDGVVVGWTSGVSYWWNTPSMSYTDTGVGAGTHTYAVQVVDPDGNGMRTPNVTVAVT